MTDTPKRRKLSHEILGLIAIAAVLSLILFLVLSGIATGVTEEYIFNHDIPMDEFGWITMYQRIYTVAAVLSCIAFSVLFLAMMQRPIAYIQTITEGIGQLQGQPKKMDLPLKGNNELKFLAEAVNGMSEAQLALREQEQALAQEKEQLIRALSHLTLGGCSAAAGRLALLDDQFVVFHRFPPLSFYNNALAYRPYLPEKYSSMTTIRLICFTLKGQRSSQCPHWRQASAWVDSLV